RARGRALRAAARAGLRSHRQHPGRVVREARGTDRTVKRMIRVEVVYALREEQALVALEVAPGASVREAIVRSGILDRFPRIDLKRTPVGVFGKAATLDSVLRDGDRVE